MEGYQFAHIELYSAKGKPAAGPEDHHGNRKNGQRAWTAQEILDELERLEHASRHVIPGRPAPEIVAGEVATFRELRDAQLAAASVKEAFPYTEKDGTKSVRHRKLRADAPTIFAAVVSLPVLTEDALADEHLRSRALETLHAAIEHERKRIEEAGGKLMMSVIHWDEKQLHAHIIALDPERGRVRHLHPGHVAKDQVLEKSKGRGIPKKEVNKLGNRAYCDAMRGWQNDFHEAVFKDAGLLRYGPRRERLSTSEYKRAKESARYRAENEAHREEIEDLKTQVGEELRRARSASSSAEEKAAALEFGTNAVLEEKVVYRPPTAKKPDESLKYGPRAPEDGEQRRALALRIQPAFEHVIAFAKKVAAADKKALEAVRLRDALVEREDALDRAEARLSWRSTVLNKVLGRMKEWVPKPIHHVVDALRKGEDPVREITADSFPDAWSIPKNPDLKAVQKRLDDMPNAALSSGFSATQDAYLLTEDDAELQATFAAGLTPRSTCTTS